ncbi:MAG: hypothetical protein ABJA74_07955 [Lapillicoccus sp.]
MVTRDVEVRGAVGRDREPPTGRVGLGGDDLADVEVGRPTREPRVEDHQLFEIGAQRGRERREDDGPQLLVARADVSGAVGGSEGAVVDGIEALQLGTGPEVGQVGPERVLEGEGGLRRRVVRDKARVVEMQAAGVVRRCPGSARTGR